MRLLRKIKDHNVQQHFHPVDALEQLNMAEETREWEAVPPAEEDEPEEQAVQADGSIAGGVAVSTDDTTTD